MSDNLSPGSSGGGIGPSLSEHGEAAPDESGMDVETAAASAYDTWDEKEHGISEADRTEWGPELKKVADHEGTNVRDGINVLVSSHINKRYGSPEIKRQALGADIDAYQINPMPSAEAAPQVFDHGNAGSETGQVIENEAQASVAVQDFVAANPIAQDPTIQEIMVDVAQDMRRQGFQPRLDAVLHHALQADPRYNDQAKQAQEANQVARARAANVQVSGAGNSTTAAGQSADVGDILDELVPR